MTIEYVLMKRDEISTNGQIAFGTMSFWAIVRLIMFSVFGQKPWKLEIVILYVDPSAKH